MQLLPTFRFAFAFALQLEMWARVIRKLEARRIYAKQVSVISGFYCSTEFLGNFPEQL